MKKENSGIIIILSLALGFVVGVVTGVLSLHLYKKHNDNKFIDYFDDDDYDYEDDYYNDYYDEESDCYSF